jgi:tryptophanyl-tRNA synthetase (EC 6.1.1.2)
MRVLSGMRPTGKLHLGHYFGVIKNWIELQRDHETYYMIADWHALTTSYKNPEQIKENIEQVMIDWIALGLDPNKSVLFIQSHVKEELELFLIFSMITPKSWLEWNPTYKDMKYNLLKIADLELSFKGGIRDLVKEFLAKLPYKVEDFEALEETFWTLSRKPL